MSSEQSFTIWSGFVRRFRESRSRRGLRGAVSHVLRESLEFLSDSTPSRLRQRWGDIDFDCDFGVDTTSARVGARTRLRGAIAGGPYQASEPELFHRMIDSLPIDYHEFTFIDLGSGKGRALLMAADYPFRRILGVELLPELHRIAEMNVRNYLSDRQRCYLIEARCGDALRFEFPSEPTVLYIFNPFPESGLSRVIARLEASLQRNHRPMYIVYHNPILEHVLSSSTALRRISGNYQVAIYANA